ncbi:esterase [Penicillium sp. IBT 18751x]|nr:esterase [Penicillium sp. IBT 18751x]
MAQSKCDRGDPALHAFRAQEIRQPLHNCIPADLLPRFDPVYVEYYYKYNAGRLHTHEVPIEDYRKDPAKYTVFYGSEPGPDVFRLTEQQCPVEGGNITIRIFEPAVKHDDQGQPLKRAAYVNFHGGGWVFGGLNTDHDYCKRLVHALDGEMVVFDVDYRLSPEHRFPVPVDDCWTAFNWIRSQKAEEFDLDPERFAVGGPSAGGHLAAVVSHLCRNAQIPLRLQILSVPVCDLHSVFTPDGEFDRENCPYDSYREMEFTPALPTARMAYFHKHFLGVPRPAASAEDWKISPMLASNFHDLAPALVSTAELDPLRDEGEVYAAKLEEAGNRVELYRYAGTPHTFPSLEGFLDSGRLHRERVVAAMKRELLQG